MSKVPKLTYCANIFLLTSFILSSTSIQAVNVDVPESQQSSSTAGVQMNLWIEGIIGDVITAGREGSIEVLAYHHQVKMDIGNLGGNLKFFAYTAS